MTVTTSPPRRRPRTGALLLATATATVAAVTTCALPAVAASGTARTAAPEAAPAIPLTDGTLDWGIKKSFRDYLNGPIAKGKITVADGARTNADGSFRFTDGSGSYDMTTHAVTTSFHGSVHLYGHHGALDIKLSDFSMETKGKSGTLSADVATGTGEDGDGKPDRTQDDVQLATLDLSEVTPGSGQDGTMAFADIPATLTEAGSGAFEGYYQKGEKLDPVTLKVTPGRGGGSAGAGSGSAGSGAGGSTSGSGGSGSGSGSGGSTASGGSGGDGNGGTGTGSGSGSGSASGGASSGTKQPASGAIADGNLDWGVKASFRKYVTGPIANGKVETSDGARSTDGGYRFPKGSGTFADGALNASFDGGVRFLGHKEGSAYSLDLTFSHLKVRAKGAKGSLVADVRSKDRASGKVSTDKAVTVASLKLDSGALTPREDIVSVQKAPATLTAAGAEAFGGFYQAGDALDPVTVAVSLDEDAALPGAGGGGETGSGGTDGGTDGGSEPAAAGGAGSVGGGDGAASLASTGIGLPSGALAGSAAALTVLGGAAVLTARRRTVGRTFPAAPAAPGGGNGS
ncbi:HtaA domain-containing protein [Streptomyces sp. RK75]|uniref:HtaA domain-containing protein n=1 Tax=Streptomyces sp. RK75 TaxID=2824895 RepID=UPI001B38B092|nr:HtaA domain-containing protein [Streptomyces sp. RK75]MBQ0867184.1 HtaA domain-containing protein [Streptomyces sp. RK75]